MGSKIGSNPRRYYGFPNESKLKDHIKINSPSLYNCIGKVKKLNKRFLKDTKGSDYMVYFRESKC